MNQYQEHKRRDLLAKAAKARKAYFTALKDAATFGAKTMDATMFHDLNADVQHIESDTADLSAHMNRLCVEMTGRPMGCQQ